jgi:hypothetical protein
MLNLRKNLKEAQNLIRGGPEDPNAILEAHGFGGAIRLYE